MVNCTSAVALVDTGSQVSTLANWFYQKHCSSETLYSCSSLLRVEGADGNKLPYLGFVVCDITLPLTGSDVFCISIPVLVVPDTPYNASVPFLMGTNYLSKVPPDTATLSSLSPAVHKAVISLHQSAVFLNKSDGVLGDVFASSDVTVHPHSGYFSHGTAFVDIPVKQRLAMIYQLGTSFPILSGAVLVNAGNNSIPFEVQNNSDFPISKRKGDRVGRLCQVYAHVSETSSSSSDGISFLGSFEFSHLAECETDELKSFLLGNRDVFAMDTKSLGKTDLVTHKIDLDDSTPFKHKARPIPPGAYSELKDHLADLLSSGVIQESKSPFASNLVLVRKKDGSLRLCVDYRKLNSRTIKDSYNLPRVDSLIDCLKGSSYFAGLDLLSGYHQVSVAPEHIERTAFSAGPFGFYEYTRMPFGLCNAPGTFQRLMEKVLEGLNMVTCAVYLDDVIIFASSKEEFYKRLAEVLNRLRKANLKLKPKKCKFLYRKLDFLGFTVSEEGISCNQNHLEAVATWPAPKNVKEVQSFLGFTNFYRRFIAGYSTIAKPLLKLLKGSGNSGRTSKARKQAPPPIPWVWGLEQQTAFNELKAMLLGPPILAYPDYEKPFILHVDACRTGLGAVLYQKSADQKLRVIAYASKALTACEGNYSAHKLEFLALKWAITTKLHHYLYGRSFEVYTDHNPLAYVTTTAKLDATGQRWLADLSCYDFHIYYKPGIQNADADGLSRRPHPETEQLQCTRHISPDVFREICSLVSTDPDFAGIGETLGVSPSVMSQAITVAPMVSIDWAVEQQKESDLVRVRQLVEKGHKLTDRQRKSESAGVMRLLTYWPSLTIKNGVLLLTSQFPQGLVDRVVIPSHKPDQDLKMVPDDLER